MRQAKGLSFMNQAKKDSHVDNYNFAIYSLQLYAIISNLNKNPMYGICIYIIVTQES